MNKNVVILAVLAVVIVGGIAVYKLSSSKKPTDPAPVDTGLQPANNYPQEVKENFVKSCVAGGGETDTCECMINRLEETLTFQEFYEADQEAAKTGVLGPKLQDAVNYCKK